MSFIRWIRINTHTHIHTHLCEFVNNTRFQKLHTFIIHLQIHIDIM